MAGLAQPALLVSVDSVEQAAQQVSVAIAVHQVYQERPESVVIVVQLVLVDGVAQQVFLVHRVIREHQVLQV